MTHRPLPLVALLLSSCALVFVALSAQAHTDATGVVKDRMDRFKESKQTLKDLKGALANADVERIESLSQPLIEWSQVLPSYFPAGSNESPSEARDAIWEDWKDFEAKSAGFEQAARNLNQAAKERQPVANLQVLYSELGASCKACHKAYKD